jgi:hypothetical protein
MLGKRILSLGVRVFLNDKHNARLNDFLFTPEHSSSFSFREVNIVEKQRKRVERRENSGKNI